MSNELPMSAKRLRVGPSSAPVAPPHDLSALKELVRWATASVRFPGGWMEVDVAQMKISEVSGDGGCATYRVTASTSELSLCLHHRPEDIVTSDTFIRLKASQAAFAAAGLAPRWITHGSDWWIEPWTEVDISAGRDGAHYWKTMGAHLASVHRIPTSWWFDQVKPAILVECPVAAAFPAGSVAWAHLARGMWQTHFLTGNPLNRDGTFRDDKPPSELRLSEEAQTRFASAFATDHPVGSRIVTCHGDYHDGNLLVRRDGTIQCIDFEFACVTHAVQDLGYIMLLNSHHPSAPATARTDFLRAYLQGLGEPASDADVASLALEAELATLASWCRGGRLGVWKLGDVGSCHVATVRSYVEAARVECSAAALDEPTLCRLVEAADERENLPVVDDAFVLEIAEQVKSLCSQIRATASLQEELLADGMAAFMQKHPFRHEREIVKMLLDRARERESLAPTVT